MTHFSATFTCLTVLVSTAVSLLAPAASAAGGLDWTKISVPAGSDISFPVTHSRIASGPVRIRSTSAHFKPRSQGIYPLESVGITNDTDCVARRVWLYWRLFRESDLEKPAFEAIDIPAPLTDLDRYISPTVRVNWVFPCDQDGTLLLEEGITYRLEIGVSRVEWSDGSVWPLSQRSPCAARGAT